MIESIKLKQLLLVLLICIGLLGSSHGQPSTSSITVQGSAMKYIEPDEVVLNLTITKKANALIDVRRKNAQTTKEIINFLNRSGVEQKDIQTNYLSIGPKVDYKTDKVLHFTSSQNLSVKIKDLTKYDQIVDGIIGLGVYSIGNPQFRNSKIREIKDQVKRMAVKKAKMKARSLASELNQTIGKAISIDEVGRSSGFGMKRSMARSAEFAADGGGDYSFAPGQILVQEGIIVAFELK